MRQFQIAYKKQRGLISWLREIRDYCGERGILERSVLFRFFSETVETKTVTKVFQTVRQEFPEAGCAGITTLGSLIHGSLTPEPVSVTCTVFEDPDSRFLILRMPMTEETQRETAERLKQAAAEHPWVRAIEILTTTYGVNLPEFCRDISALPEGIAVYGGGAHARNVSHGERKRTFVFSGDGEMTPGSAVFILLGGASLQVKTDYMTGWRGIGRKFAITAEKDGVLSEIEGRPALEVYQHYLNVPSNDQFFRLSNVFPFLIGEKEGESFLRVISAHLPDGKLQLAASIDQAVNLRFTYGDPANIMKDVDRMVQAFAAFAPQSLQVFSCAARRIFWGDGEVSRETLPFEQVSGSSGFFTSGEILRVGRDVRVHNCTLVLAGLREGDAPSEIKVPFSADREVFSRAMQVAGCLANFINVQEEEKAGGAAE